MPTTSWSPGMVPYGADETVYLVIDSFGANGTVYRETEIEKADVETIVGDLLSGQYNSPVRIVAFNTLEHWSEDVSSDVAAEIQTRCDMDGVPVPEHLTDFVQTHWASGTPVSASACLTPGPPIGTTARLSQNFEASTGADIPGSRTGR
jgi:hypothetical protein